MTDNKEDRFSRIREALEMGPTPGPWQVSAGAVDNPRLIVENDLGLPVCAMSMRGVHGDINKMEANARLIAACDPDTIRELLAERDALAEENERLRNALAAKDQLIESLMAEMDAEQFAASNGDSLSSDAIHAVREMLKGAGVPAAAFIDDHVGNAIVQRDQERTRAEAAEARVAGLEKALDQIEQELNYGHIDMALRITRRALEGENDD